MNARDQKFPWSYPLTPESLTETRNRLGYSQVVMAGKLGIGRTPYQSYERSGRESNVPKYIELACAAITLGLENILNHKTLKEWRSDMGFTSQGEAAAALGMSKMKYFAHEKGHRPNGVKVKNPEYVGLACAAIAHGITEYKGPET